ncbi:MAG: UMP kinase, partial [Ruminococcaceae bacterium]|nr:UMP kinase [Oscillospiraceae bacterium]
MAERKYNRILLKISGEALAGKSKFGIDNDTLHQL